MIIPVQPKNLLTSDTDFFREIEESNIVLKDKEVRISQEVHRWPNPVRRTAATRKVVGSNPTLCFGSFLLEKENLHQKKTILLEKRNACERETILLEKSAGGKNNVFERETNFVGEELIDEEEFIKPIEPEFDLKVDFEIPRNPFEKGLPTPKERLKREERDSR